MGHETIWRILKASTAFRQNRAAFSGVKQDLSKSWLQRQENHWNADPNKTLPLRTSNGLTCVSMQLSREIQWDVGSSRHDTTSPLVSVAWAARKISLSFHCPTHRQMVTTLALIKQGLFGFLEDFGKAMDLDTTLPPWRTRLRINWPFPVSINVIIESFFTGRCRG